MEFIETSIFTKLIYTYLTDDEYLGLQGYMLKYPEAGKIVPGSGGVRKLRWAIGGKGKSQRRSEMSERNIGMQILEGIREIKAYKAGQRVLRTHKLKRPAPPQRIRAKLRLSQAAFAGLMGVSLRTVQDWEQGRRKPSGPAEALLQIAEQHPEVFMRLV